MTGKKYRPLHVSKPILIMFYRYAANKSVVRASVGPLTDSDGGTINEPQKIVETLLLQYKFVFSNPVRDKIIKSPMNFLLQGTDCTSKLTGVTLSKDNIEEAIKEMATTSTAGSDHFPAVLLKRCANELSVPFVSLYTFSLESSIILKQLKTANITPIHKGGSKTEAKNYRPVALTYHIIKVLERIIAKKIAQYLERNNKMNQDQHGFRTARSCVSQLLAHHEKKQY